VPSTTVTTEQQQSSHHDILKPTLPKAKHTSNHTTSLLHPQNGKTNPVDNTSSQTYAEAPTIHSCDDLHYHTTNQNPTDALCFNPMICSQVMQQQNPISEGEIM